MHHNLVLGVTVGGGPGSSTPTMGHIAHCCAAAGPAQDSTFEPSYQSGELVMAGSVLEMSHRIWHRRRYRAPSSPFAGERRSHTAGKGENTS